MNTVSRKFEDLIAWQRAHDFVLGVYKYSTQFPESEQLVLTSQFRNAAISIAANIAEGFRNDNVTEKLKYYKLSQGSIEECRYFLILSQDLNYGDNNNLLQSLEEVKKILSSYMKSIEVNMN